LSITSLRNKEDEGTSTFKIPYSALPDFRLLKIPIHLKIPLLQNLFSIILYYVLLHSLLLKLLLLLKIHHLHNLFNIILHHVFLLQSLHLKLLILLLKIHHLHKFFSIILHASFFSKISSSNYPTL
jgi:hypothetical protein